MRVDEAMTRVVRFARPDQSVREVATVMAEFDTGFIPVAEAGKLVGTLTDRDIALRVVSAGKGTDTPVRDVMTRDVKYCFEDEDLEGVARNMASAKVRRLPVFNRDKRLVGVIALGDMAQFEKTAAAEAIAGASTPGGPHNQARI